MCTCSSSLPETYMCFSLAAELFACLQTNLHYDATSFQTTINLRLHSSFFTARRQRGRTAPGKLTPVDINLYFFRVELYRYLICGYCSYYTPVSSCSAKGSSRYPREGRQICFLRGGGETKNNTFLLGLLVYPLHVLLLCSVIREGTRVM